MIRPFSFTFGPSTRTIYGGPYRERPKSYFGVKMAEEIKAPCDVDIPTPDFGLPDPEQVLQGLQKILPRIAVGAPVYVGCMGGIGRTGLFLGCLVSLLGEPKPVAAVRARYLSHAIETEAQQAFVAVLDGSPEWRKAVGFWIKIAGLCDKSLMFKTLARWAVERIYR